MYRIDDNTAATQLPALPTDSIGSPGYFTGGNPGASPPVPPTRVRFWWLNLVQESLMALLFAAGLTPSKSDSTLVLQAIRKLRTITVTRRVISSSGTYTPPANLLFADIEAIGGGGGGGGATGSSGTSSAGGGGGAGGYARAWLTAEQIGAQQTVTVGAFGPGSAYGQNSGGNGGGSSFGGYLTGSGGSAGVGCPAFSGSAPGGGGGAGGTASASVSGAILTSGEAGSAGITFPSGASGMGGRGGSSRLGAGAAQGYQTDSGSAPTGSGYGSGGAGSGRSTTSLGGGTGAPGVVIITEYSTLA